MLAAYTRSPNVLKYVFEAPQCIFPGLYMQWLVAPTEYATSGWVSTIAQMKLTTTDAQGIFLIWSFSTSVQGDCLSNSQCRLQLVIVKPPQHLSNILGLGELLDPLRLVSLYPHAQDMSGFVKFLHGEFLLKYSLQLPDFGSITSCDEHVVHIKDQIYFWLIR